MEIERKYLIHQLPEDLAQYPCLAIEQAYICTEPVVRIRKQNEKYILTTKGGGMMSREELNLPMSEEAYEKMRKKAEGTIITKKRYLIPLPEDLTIELDVFEGEWQGLKLAEVEFTSEAQANAFVPPAWFGEDVTFDGRYHNSYLSCHSREKA